MDIRCRNCAHGKVWHQDEGRCYFDHECDCEAWNYGINVDKFDRGFTRCDECEDGLVCGCERGKHDPHPRDVGHTMFIDRFDGVPCISCSGSGLVPTEKLREEAAVALYEGGDRFGNSRSTMAWADAGDHYRGWIQAQADAVLRKVAEHIREGR